MEYLGQVDASSTIRVFFTTHAATGAAVAPSTAFEAADVRIYKDGSATQRSSEAGYTMTSPFDSVTGLHLLSVDLSDNTDASFYAAGSRYTIVLVPSDETVDSVAVVRVLADFKIGPVSANVTQWLGTAAATPTVAGVPEVDVTHFNGTAGTFASGIPSVNAAQVSGDATAADTLELFAEAIDQATGQLDSGSLAAGTLTAAAIAADALTAAKVASDVGTEIGTAVWATTTRVLTAGTNIALAKGTGVTGFNDLSAAQVNAEADTAIADAALATAANLATVDGKLPAALVGGRIDATVDATGMEAGAVDTILDELVANGLTARTALAIAASGAIGSFSVDDVAATTTSFVTDLTSVVDNFYRDMQLLFTSGALMGQMRVITDYVGSTKVLTLDEALTSAPANGVTFVVSGPHTHSMSQIADAVLDEALSGHTGAGSLGKAIADIETDVDAVLVDTADMQPKLGSPAGASLAADIAAIEAQTDDIGALGAGLTAIIGADGDTLKSLSDQIDGLSTAAAPQLLQNTTIATLATQTSFTLTAGSADNDAYNGAIVVVTDSATATQKAVGAVSDYVGSTKTVTLVSDPGIFTMAVGDTVDILAAISNAPTAAAIRSEIDSNSTQLAAIVADTNELQGDWANGGRLDIILDARASQTSVDDLPTNAELSTALAAADDAVLAAIAALNNLSEANVRTAVGLGSANLDTQLGDLPTNAELATALGTADDAVLAAIAALNNLSSAQAQTAAAAALTAYDPPTQTELLAVQTSIEALINALNDISAADVLTQVNSGLDATVADSVPADGSRPSLRQAAYLNTQFLLERAVSGTTLTVNKADGTTALITLTLNSATAPTSITRAS